MEVNLKNVQRGDVLLVSKLLFFSGEQSYDIVHVSDVSKGIISTHEGSKYLIRNGFELTENNNYTVYGYYSRFKSKILKVWKENVINFAKGEWVKNSCFGSRVSNLPESSVKIKVLCFDSRTNTVSESTQVLTSIIKNPGQGVMSYSLIVNGFKRFTNTSWSDWYDKYSYYQGTYHYIILDKIVFKGA